MFSLYQLRVFLTVAEEGSVTRAAERLYFTQPAVSQHIRALEKQVGVRLFDRTARGMTLTPAGETLMEYARRIVRLAVEAHQAVARVGNLVRGNLHLGASPGVGSCLVPSWIHTFHLRNPEMRVILRTDTTPTIVRFLVGGDVELAIVEGEVEDSRVRVVPLWDEEIVLVVGPHHPWWGKEKVSSEALADQWFVSREEGSLTRAWEERVLRNYGITPRVIAQFDTPSAIKRAVESGLGIALLPLFAVRTELHERRLHAVRLQDERLQRTLRLLYMPERLQNPVIRAFLQYLSTEFPHIGVHIHMG